MGAGFHGGFGDTKGAVENKFPSLPKDQSKLKHIFGDREGHMPDTSENRKLLIELACDPSKYIGKDKFGNIWHAEIQSDGSQLWVRFRDGMINEGGKNETPRFWDTEFGLNNNPFKRRKSNELL